MNIHRVDQSSAINMLGPYLTAEAVCPVCGTNNVLLHLESVASPVKAYKDLICPHLTAREVDDDGNGIFEFTS